MNILLLIVSYIIAIVHLILKPEQIPSHWNAKGIVDGYMSYPWGIIIYPFFITIIYLTGIFLKKIDPFLKNNSKKWMPIVFSIMIVFIILQIYTILYMFFMPTFNMFPLIFGLMIIIMGNYFPVLPRNGFIGIRTPWTLASDFVWKKTHKVSGYLAIITGILCVIMSFTKYSYISIYIIIAWAVISFIYSFFVWKFIKD